VPTAVNDSKKKFASASRRNPKPSTSQCTSLSNTLHVTISRNGCNGSPCCRRAERRSIAFRMPSHSVWTKRARSPVVPSELLSLCRPNPLILHAAATQRASPGEQSVCASPISCSTYMCSGEKRVPMPGTSTVANLEVSTTVMSSSRSFPPTNTLHWVPRPISRAVKAVPVESPPPSPFTRTSFQPHPPSPFIPSP
jgi:hypothetical protein